MADSLSPDCTLACRAENERSEVSSLRPKRSAFRRMHSIRRITLRSSALHVAFCFLFSAFCYAEELPDPTRPPVISAMPAIAASGVADNQPARLQSIIISKTRRAAIIDGETVELGDKHGDAKLIEVNEGSVVLRGTQGRQVMTLFPDVKMTLSRTPAGNKEQKVKTKPQSPKSPQSPESKMQPERQKANQALTGGEK